MQHILHGWWFQRPNPQASQMCVKIQTLWWLSSQGFNICMGLVWIGTRLGHKVLPNGLVPRPDEVGHSLWLVVDPPNTTA